MDGELKIFNFGKYGQALAWIKAGRLRNIVEVQGSEKTHGLRTAKATEDMKERVLAALRRR